jgi:hypothetical protein
MNARQSRKQSCLQEKTMNKAVYRFASLVMALVMILTNITNTKAAGNVYYVSPTGNDTHPGTASAPFRTFAKANSVLTPGSTLFVYAGVYNERLRITKSGTASEVISVKPVGGVPTIDLGRLTSPGLEVRAAFVTVTGLEVRNASDVCVNLAGAYITVIGLIVHDCMNHGIQANNSSNIQILSSRVYRTVLSNAARVIPNGWGSAIKIRESNTVLLQGNTVYANYGEGMGTRGVNVTIRGNAVFNNYSVNIYTNSENAVIERNFVYCTPNSGYERNGLPAVGIGLAEEYFPNWGARLRNARVLNNIVTSCRNGVRYMGADEGVLGGGLKGAIIAYNTLYGSTNAALSISYEPAQFSSLIANNIIWQAQNKLTFIENPIGLIFQNNLWKVAPEAAFRSLGDRYGDPGFATTPGYTPDSYRPSNTSPAASTAAHIGVWTDYFTRLRGPAYDIGAIQFFVPNLAANTQEMDSPTLPSETQQTTPTVVPPTVQPTNTPVSVTPTLVVSTSSPTALPPTATSTSVPVQASPTVTVQETKYDNKNSAFVYSAGWADEVSSYAIDGSFARTSTNGASVTFPFTGQSFSIVYKGGPSYRNMDVYIDDLLVATINEKHNASTYKARWDYPGQLSPGQHTLKLVFVTTSSSTNGSVDAVIVR